LNAASGMAAPLWLASAPFVGPEGSAGACSFDDGCEGFWQAESATSAQQIMTRRMTRR